MRFFDNIFGKKDNTEEVVNNTKDKKITKSENFLDLKKGNFLNLSKSDSTLEHIRLAAGWDVNNNFGADFDLDLMANLIHSNGKNELIYFGNMKSSGIELDKDNLTGVGDGDDENINIYFNKLNNNINKIDIYVIIYKGKERNQNFSKVENAYVKVVDEEQKKELCRYNMSKDEGKHVSIKAGSFEKKENDWIFTAIGEYGNLKHNNL